MLSKCPFLFFLSSYHWQWNPGPSPQVIALALLHFYFEAGLTKLLSYPATFNLWILLPQSPRGLGLQICTTIPGNVTFIWESKYFNLFYQDILFSVVIGTKSTISLRYAYTRKSIFNTKAGSKGQMRKQRQTAYVNLITSVITENTNKLNNPSKKVRLQNDKRRHNYMLFIGNTLQIKDINKMKLKGGKNMQTATIRELQWLF